MHQCLCIDDIMRVVFGFIDEHEYDSYRGLYVRQEHSLRMLSALSRTCQTFKDPALDVLWREIPDSYVLIKSHIPSHLLRIKKSSLSFVSQPNLEDWKRLDPYINRIRIIGTPLPFAKPTRLLLHEESVLRPLDQYLRQHGPSTEGRSLLPNLAEVIWNVHWDRNQSIMRGLLMGPSIRCLRYTNVEPTRIVSLISQTSTPTTVRDLTLHGARYLSDMSLVSTHTEVLDGLRTFHNLERISITLGFLSEDTIAHLTSLPTLTSLGLHIHLYTTSLEEVALGPTSNRHAVRFSHLRKLSLTIDGYYGRASLPFIERYVDISTLESFTLTFALQGPDRTETQFLQWLLESVAPAAPTLREFSIYTGVPRRTWGWYSLYDPDFRFANFPGLLQFTQLRTLRFEDQRDLCPVTNETLRVIADAFPNLEFLGLCTPTMTWYEGRLEPEKLPTLDGLLPIAERCRNLHTLRLPIRSTLVHPEETLCAASRCASTVRTLSLWATPLEVVVEQPAEMGYEAAEDSASQSTSAFTPEDAATFIREVFPNVDDLRIILPADDTFGLNRAREAHGWTDVLDMLADMDTPRSLTRSRVIM